MHGPESLCHDNIWTESWTEETWVQINTSEAYWLTLG